MHFYFVVISPKKDALFLPNDLQLDSIPPNKYVSFC